MMESNHPRHVGLRRHSAAFESAAAAVAAPSCVPADSRIPASPFKPFSSSIFVSFFARRRPFFHAAWRP